MPKKPKPKPPSAQPPPAAPVSERVWTSFDDEEDGGDESDDGMVDFLSKKPTKPRPKGKKK